MSYNLSDKGPFCVTLKDTPEHFNEYDALDVVKDFNPQYATPVEENKWIVSLKNRNDVENAVRQSQVHFVKDEDECIVLITECEPDQIPEEWKEMKAEDDEMVDQGSGQATAMPDSDERVELRTGPPSVQISASSDPINTRMPSRQQYSYPPNPMDLQQGSNNPAMHQYPLGYEQPPMDSRGMNPSQQKNENPVPQFQQNAYYDFQQHVPSFLPPGAGIPYSHHPHQHPGQFYGGPGQHPFPPHGHPPYFAPQFPGYPPNYPGSPYQQGGSYYQQYNQVSRLDQSQNSSDEFVSPTQHKSPSQSTARSKHQDNADEAQLKKESVLQEQPYVQHQRKQDTSSTRMDDEKKQIKEEEHVLTAKSRKLKVANVPHGVRDDALEMFFENEKRSGGGEVKYLDFDPDSSTAIIEFEDPSVIDRVLQKLPLAIQGKQLKIEVYKEADTSEKVAEDENENDLPKMTVEVRGLSEDTSADALEMYFENKKRSGGGPISNIEWKDAVALITFESEAATNAVLERRHKLNGRDLDVKLYVPPKPVPMYQDKLLITGLNEKITKDCLINFLEARSSSSPTEILYSQDDEQKALVTFESPPDFQKLKEACQKRKLEGAILEVSQVPISRCVLVTNLATKTSEDTVTMYFENTRRSGGGPVERVEMMEEEGACCIYFEDLSVIDSVLGRKHKLDNSEIQLQLFHPCISRTTSAEKRSKFQNPESFVYKVNVHIIAFFRQVPNTKVWLEQEISKVHGRVVVSSDNSNTLEVFPMLTSEMDGVKSLAKTWKKTAEQKLEECMKHLDCMEHQVMPDLWVSTLAQLGKIQIPNEKDVIVCTDQQHSIVRVVGLKNMVNHVSQNLKQIITDGEKELELKKQRTSDRKTLPKQEICFLSAVKFPDKVHAKYRDVKCTIQQKDDTIVFEGLLLDIKQAQLLMFETIQTIAKSSMPDYSRSKLELLAMKETCDYIRQKLEEKGYLGVWETDGNSVIVYDESNQKANEGIQIIKKCLVENTINITPEQRLVINSQVFKALLADINRQHQGHTIIHVHVQNSTIEITATDQYAGKIIETVQDFISANALYNQTVTVDPLKIRYLEQWKKPQIDEICKSLQNNMVTIDLSPGVITLQGTQKGLSEAVSRLSTLLKQMCSKQTLLEKPGICKYLCSDKGEELIKHIENVNKCTIDLTNQEDDQTSLEESQLDLQKHLQHPVEYLSCKMLGGRTMSVFHGDITDLDIHILINPCNNTLDHSAGLAKAVVEKGGDVILGECEQFRRRRLMDGDVVYTKGGNLKCRVVAHCVSPIWQGGNDNEEEYLTEVVLKSLEETDKRRLPSIGIPAIGTGIFGWPISVATATIIKSVQEYFQDHSKSVIKNVFLCDLDAQHVKSFMDAVKKAFPNDDVTLLVDPSQIAAKGSPSLGRSSGGSLSSSSSDSNSGTLAYRIEVVKGEMARQQADVLVNTTSSTLNLSQGAVSASLLAIGGQQLQEECTKKYPDGINPGDVAITGAGELRCACIFHGCLPEWKHDGSTLSILKTFMKNCLSEADRMKMTSIAFPALGTGTLKYPKDVVASEMFNCVSDFFSKNRGTSLVAVYVVVYQKDLETLKVFEKEQKEFLNRLSSPSKQAGKAKYKKKQGQGKQVYSDSFTATSNPQSLEYIQVPQLKIIPGDITTFSVDAIVNPSDAAVGLEGGVSQAILRKAGPELKEMCFTLGKEMKKKGYVVTPGFKLPCHCIIHVNVRDQDYGWKGIILKCLEEAVKKKLRSIAFPALGTGQVGGNPEEIGKALFEATSEIIQAGSSTLQEIQMVVFQSEMVSKIEEGIKSAQQSIPKTSSWWQNIKGLFGYGKGVSSAQPNVLRADGMKVFIHICADSESVIQDAVDGLEKKFNQELDTDAVTDDVIKRLSEDKVSSIEGIGKRYSVMIKVEKRLGRVRIEGLLADVGKVKTEVLSLMRDIEKMENKEKQATMLSQLVQWYYIEITKGQDLVEYPKDINATLEDAYQRKEKKLKLHVDGGIINIDFDALEGYPIKDPNSKVKVLRKDKIKESGSEIPPHWGPMGKDNLMIIPLQPGSKEYKDVASLFMATVKKEKTDASIPISKIERIQNRTLYAQYQSKKKLIDENNPGQQNEKDLWHGTAEHAVASINVHGFNRSFCGKNATMYGEGVYFAREAYYSARDLYSPLDASGNKRMYLTKVLTGKYAQGAQGMRVPPPLVPGHPELHDSVIDDTKNPFIFVIFHDTQAYPEYLITFKWN